MKENALNMGAYMLLTTVMCGVGLGYLLRLLFVRIQMRNGTRILALVPEGWKLPTLVALAVLVVLSAPVIVYVYLYIPSHMSVYARPTVAVVLGFAIGVHVSYLFRRRRVSVLHLVVFGVLIIAVLAIHPWSQLLRGLGMKTLLVPTPVGSAKVEFQTQALDSDPADAPDSVQNEDALVGSDAFFVIPAVVERIDRDDEYVNLLSHQSNPAIAQEREKASMEIKSFFSHTVLVLSKCAAGLETAIDFPARFEDVSRPTAYHLFSLLDDTWTKPPPLALRQATGNSEYTGPSSTRFTSSFVLGIRDGIRKVRLHSVAPSDTNCPFSYPLSQASRKFLSLTNDDLGRFIRHSRFYPYPVIVLAYLLQQSGHQRLAKTVLAEWVETNFFEWLERRSTSSYSSNVMISLIRALWAWDHISQTYENSHDFELGAKYIQALEDLLGTAAKTMAPRKMPNDLPPLEQFLVVTGEECDRESSHSRTKQFIYLELLAKNNFLNNVTDYLDLLDFDKASFFVESGEYKWSGRRRVRFSDEQEGRVRSWSTELLRRTYQGCTEEMFPEFAKFDRATFLDTYAGVAFSFATIDYVRSKRVDVYESELQDARCHYLDARRYLAEAEALTAEPGSGGKIPISELERLSSSISRGLDTVSAMFEWTSGSREITLVRGKSCRDGHKRNRKGRLVQKRDG